MAKNHDFKIELTRGKIIHNLPNGHQVKNAKRLTIASFIITFFYILGSIQSASADPLDLVEFDSPTYTLNDDIFFSVSESTFANSCSETGAGTPGVITVTITSTRPGVGLIDSITLEAIEIDDPTPGLRTPTAGTCIFGNTILHIMADDQRFSIGDTVAITQIDTSGGRTTDNTVTTINVDVSSDSDLGFVLTLTETGRNTGTFTNQLTFVSGSTSAEKRRLHVEAGDIINVEYLATPSYGQILPSPDGSVGVLLAKVDDTITVTYTTTGAFSDALITDGGGPGGGGGGLIRPGLVLDLIVGGVGSRDHYPPSLTLSKQRILAMPLVDYVIDFILNADPFTPLMPISNPTADFPLLINENGYVLSGYSNTIQTHHAATGEPIEIQFLLFDNTGIEHVALYMNLRGNEREVSNSGTYIIYEEGKEPEIVDPQGFFSNVDTKVVDEGTKYIILYNITFAKPMDTSDIIIRSWDHLRNSGDIKIFDAIKIEGEPLYANAEVSIQTTTFHIPYFKTVQYVIPFQDSQGHIRYYDTFGNLKEKKVHPYYTPFIYSDDIGRSERHDDGFWKKLIEEEIKAQSITSKIIYNPFVEQNKINTDYIFVYPKYVGNLDRRNLEALENEIMYQNSTAIEIFAKLYQTNQIDD